MTATWRGDPSTGGQLAASARKLYEGLGLRDKVGETYMAEGFALWQARDFEAARPLWEAALGISRELGADTLAVTQLAGLAGIEHDTGAHAEATRIALDALDQACDLDNVGHCVWLLDLIAAFVAESDPAGAVRLAGAADALRRASGGGMRVEDLHIEPARTAAGRALGASEVERAWNDGRSLDLREAMALARSFRPESID